MIMYGIVGNTTYQSCNSGLHSIAIYTYINTYIYAYIYMGKIFVLQYIIYYASALLLLMYNVGVWV